MTTASLTDKEVETINKYWQACNYLAASMIYLRENPLLKQPLKPEHIKLRLLGHWGANPGLSFSYIHLNRLIKKYDLNAIFLAGVLAPVYLEGTYSEIYPNKSEDEEGLLNFFKAGGWCACQTKNARHADRMSTLCLRVRSRFAGG